MVQAEMVWEWAKPEYSAEEVDAAGMALVNSQLLHSLEDYEHALSVINNWRSSHAFPLNTFQVGLRHKAKQVERKPLVAQRIKRLSSIEHKLERFDWLRLAEMQDIGGCRAVVGSVRSVDRLVDVWKSSSIKHKLDDEDDYIRNPKKSGYRGIHLIYRYYSDKKETYNGLKIEMQFRSPLQHAWATAVETVGTFIGQALKSSLGEDRWLRFFALMGTAIAMREKTARVPETPDDDSELFKELRKLAQELDVKARLATYGAALKAHEEHVTPKAHYFLLQLDSRSSRIHVTGYSAMELDDAAEAYSRVEREIRGQEGQDAVLVSVESLTALRRAYPNYFLDTRAFLEAVEEAVSR